MKLAIASAFVCLMAALVSAAPLGDSALAALRAYEGTWHVTRSNAPAGVKPEEFKAQCDVIGKFFACQQSVNGDVSALMVFVPINGPGHYATQSINPNGRALGRGELEISGNRWMFSSTWEQGNGRATYYHTIYTFDKRDHIHFEQQESTNGRDYTLKNTGDQTRVSAAR